MVQVRGFLLLSKRRGLDFLRQFICFSCPTIQADHVDARLGTLQEKQTPQGSYTAGLWAQRMSSPGPHPQTGHTCAASSAVTERVTEPLRFPGGLSTGRKQTQHPQPPCQCVSAEQKLLSSKKTLHSQGHKFWGPISHVLSLRGLQGFIF